MAIKPISSDSTVSVIWPDDPAIDTDAMADDGEKTCIEAFAEKAFSDPGCWRDILKMRPGETPTEFIIGAIPPSELSAIEDDYRASGGITQSTGMQWACFKASLRDIKNGPTERIKRGGSYVEEVPKSKRGSVERVDPAWLETVFSRGLRNAARWVGMTAWTWNNLNEADAKN